MSLLNFIKNLIKAIKPEKFYFDEFKEKRKKIKAEIDEALIGLNFTTIERNEVLNIVDEIDGKIAVLKAKLVGTNITNGSDSNYPREKVDHIMSQITTEQNKMDQMLRQKVQEILDRKNKNKVV